MKLTIQWSEKMTHIKISDSLSMDGRRYDFVLFN